MVAAALVLGVLLSSQIPLNSLSPSEGVGHAAHSLATDAANNLYVGGSDRAFITKFDAFGTRVVYSVQLSSPPSDSVEALAADAYGNVYAAGAAGQGGFLAEIGPSGEQLSYRSLPAAGVAVALDIWGGVYYAAGNSIARLDAAPVAAPGVVRAIAVTRAGAVYAAGAGFLARLNMQADGWDWVLALGGADVRALAVDANGALYLTGVAGSESFAARVRPDGSGFDWRTTLAPGGAVAPYALAVDPRCTADGAACELLVAGDLLIASSSPAPGDGISSSGFVVRLDAAGNLLGTSAIGAMQRDHVRAVAIDGTGQAFAAGWIANDPPDLLLAKLDDIRSAAASTSAGNAFDRANATADVGIPRPMFVFPRAATGGFTLGATSLTVGPGSGANSVLLAGSEPWTASTSDSWLHLASGSTGGTGGALVAFTYEANPNATSRTGTITFNGGGLVLTVTQVGSGYAPVSVMSTVVPYASNVGAQSLAVDNSGNVYILSGNSKVWKWDVSTRQLTTVISTGLYVANGIAIDSAGNLYIAEYYGIAKWTASTQQLTMLISSTIAASGVAVDSSGNVYIADWMGAAVKKWTASTQQLSTLVSPISPTSVALDASGNVFIADVNHTIKKWTAATQQLSTLIATGLGGPYGVAVDGAGNLYIADYPPGGGTGIAVRKWTASTQQLTVLFAASGLNGVAVDAAGNVYAADVGALLKWTAATQRVGTLIGGPALQSPQGLAMDRSGNLYIAESGNGTVKKLEAATGLLVSVAAYNGVSSVAADDSGNIYMANTGDLLGVRELTAATQQISTVIATGAGALAVDAAGNLYRSTKLGTIDQWTAANQQLTTVVSNGLSLPLGLALDGSGNVYIADTGNNAVRKWTASTQRLTTLGSWTLNGPTGITVDGAGNVYIADTNNNAIKKWTAATQQLSDAGCIGLKAPWGLAADAAGNLYVADSGNGAIKKATFAYVSLTPVIEPPAAGSGSLPAVIPADTPLDATSDLGWLTITGTANGVVSFSFAANTGPPRVAHITLLGQTITVTQAEAGPPVLSPNATDSGGGTFTQGDAGRTFTIRLANLGGTATTGTATLALALSPGLTPVSASGAGWSCGAAAGGFTCSNAASVGSGATYPDLSLTVNVAGDAAGPQNVQVQASGGGAGNTASASGTVAIAKFLGANALAVDSGAGSSSVVVNAAGPWSATAIDSWLHVAGGSISGTGSALVLFSYDANANPLPRTGTISFNGGRVSLTVTQAGAGYATAVTVRPLIQAGLSYPFAVALDSGQNLYIADGSGIKKWAPWQQLVTLRNNPYLTAMTVDKSGTQYFAQAVFDNIVKQDTTIIPSLHEPYGMAVDDAGNLYIADTYNGAIEKWTASTQLVTTVVSTGLYMPGAVAVDGAGNLYIADSGNNAIKKWTASTQQMSTLVSGGAGLNTPLGVAVDGAGNVYIADTYNRAVKKWIAATSQLITLAGAANGLQLPMGLAFDGAGNLYVADYNAHAVDKITSAYVPAAGVSETAAPGTDSLPAVVPANLAVGAQSDQNWLTITGVANGVVSFAFTANASAAPRVAHILLLEQSITVTQAAAPASPLLSVSVTDAAGGAFTQGDLTRTFNIQVANWGATTNGQVTVRLTLTSDLIPVGTPLGTGWTCVTATGGFTCTNPGEVAFGSRFADLNITVSVAGNAAASQSVQAQASGGGAAGTATATDFVTVRKFLGTDALTVDGGAGSNSAILTTSGSWTASTSDSWLHLASGSTGGTGNALVVFSYDANPNGTPRTGAVSFNNGATRLTVTQAGTGYVTASYLSALPGSGLASAVNLAADAQGNLYSADYSGAVWKWAASTQQLSRILFVPGVTWAVAADASGNVYLLQEDDPTKAVLLKLTAPAMQPNTLVSSGLNYAVGIAADTAGNVYVANTNSNVVSKWTASTRQFTTLFPTGAWPISLALDRANHLYLVYSQAHIALLTPFPQQLATISGPATTAAVDSSGNVYFSSQNNVLKKWSASTMQTSTATSHPGAITGLAADGSGNIYAAISCGYFANCLHKLITAQVNLTGVSESPAAGSDSLPPVLPAATPLDAQSDQNWLTITGMANGVVTFSFTANPSTSSRTAHISLLGQSVTVTQAGAAPVLGITVSDSASGTFAQGDANRTFTVHVANNGTAATSGTVTVSLSSSAGLSAVGAPSGAGWSCVSATGGFSCTSGAVVAAGASFSDLTLTVNVASGAASPQSVQVQASGGGASATTSVTDSVTITQVATKLAFTSLPSSGAVGLALGTVAVQVQDAGGRVVAGSTAPVTITSTPAGATGTLSANAVNGVATFSGLVFSTAGSYTLQANSAGLASATSSTVTVGAYMVGDVFPLISATGDRNGDGSTYDAGEFGDNGLNVLDLIIALRSVTSLPGYKFEACMDIFDAIDSYPPDAGAARGGDGSVNILDLIITLRRVTGLDQARPVRSARGQACTASAGPTEPLKVSTSASGRPAGTPVPLSLTPAAVAIELGVPVRKNGIVHVPLSLTANEPLRLAGLALSLGTERIDTRLNFVSGTPAVSLSDNALTGGLSLAWLDGLSLAAGQRLLLGYVEAPSARLVFYGCSAATPDGHDVRVSLPGESNNRGTTGKQ